MSTSAVITAIGPSEKCCFWLLRSDHNILQVAADGRVTYTLGTSDWSEIGAQIQQQIQAGHVLQLKLSPSEGKLYLSAAANGATHLDLVLGDIKDFDDQIVNLVHQANDRLANLRVRPS